jgi:hypothetical protein
LCSMWLTVEDNLNKALSVCLSAGRELSSASASGQI